MQIILSDHNCEGHAQQIVFALDRIGLAAIVPIQLLFFTDVGLPFNAHDEAVWQLCQKEDYLLLTGNRRTVDGKDSLELVIRRLYALHILPVVTIGDLNRVLHDRDYCDRCAERLAEIVLDVEILRGVTRLYLP
jgi:hypothetical protein